MNLSRASGRSARHSLAWLYTAFEETPRTFCRSCNEKMWSDGRPVHPSRAIGQANKGGYAWLEIANPVETVGAILVGHPS